MVMTIKQITAGLMAALSLITTLPAQAALPEVSLTVRPLADNDLRDGTVVARGWVTDRTPHAGLQVWLEALRQGEAPDRYVLTGQNDPGHTLRVRLRADTENGVPDEQSGRGLLIRTTEEQVSLVIEADGAQQAPPDVYPLILKAGPPAD